MKINTPKVMLVDDEPHIVDYVSEILMSIDFRVIATATNGQEAIDKVVSTELELDMVVLDVTMPGLTGDETIKKIKAYKDDIVVVMLSSRNALATVKKCIENGASGYILKSESGEKICQKLQEIWFSRLFDQEGNV